MQVFGPAAVLLFQVHDALTDGADGGFGAVLDLEFAEEGFYRQNQSIFEKTVAAIPPWRDCA